MKGLVKVGFTDKNTGLYLSAGTPVEFADARIKELADLGYVELKNAPKTEPVKVEPKAEPKAEKKTSPKVKPVAETVKKTTKKK